MTQRCRSTQVAAGAALLALLLVPFMAGCPRSGNDDEIVVTINDEGGGEAAEVRSEDQLYALARAEGEVSWYTSVPETEASKFCRLFEAHYPSLRVRLVRGGTFDLVSRIERSISSGQREADVLHVLDPAIFLQLRQRGELMYYQSPAAAAIAPEYREPGYWTTARMAVIGLAYDKRRLKAPQAPRQWHDLLDSRWRGQIGLKDAQTAGSAYAQYYFLRERYGVDFWEQLAALRPRIYKTEEDLLDALVNGEVRIAAGVMGNKSHEYAQRHPTIVGSIWPSDGVPLVIGPVAILNRAPHPNAARLFLDYCLSQAGQTALRDLLGAYSPRADVASPPGAPALSTLRILPPPVSWEEYLQKQGDLRAEYARMFHGESE